jgi:hypothetical protein
MAPMLYHTLVVEEEVAVKMPLGTVVMVVRAS